MYRIIGLVSRCLMYQKKLNSSPVKLPHQLHTLLLPDLVLPSSPLVKTRNVLILSWQRNRLIAPLTPWPLNK